MSNTITLMGLFEDDTATSAVLDDFYDLGVEDDHITVISSIPYPEQALGRHHVWIRLPTIVLIGALLGFLFGYFLSSITPRLYPINVSGHPFTGGPPAAIITYIFTMLFAVITTFIGVLWEIDVPGFEKKYYDKKVTSGQLAVVLEDIPLEKEAAVIAAMEANGGKDIRRPEKV
ncbi:MAG: DUF3341 domain-containing protein, partial [Hyphomicrobiales bacterium]|nr:DUF3341 domain-containing protein [Hyphomicrobiales bacterium]